VESRDEAAPSHRTWKTPARSRRRFPQLPQPLLLEKHKEKRENQTRRPNNPILQNLTYTTHVTQSLQEHCRDHPQITQMHKERVARNRRRSVGVSPATAGRPRPAGVSGMQAQDAIANGHPRRGETPRRTQARTPALRLPPHVVVAPPARRLDRQRLAGAARGTRRRAAGATLGRRATNCPTRSSSAPLRASSGRGSVCGCGSIAGLLRPARRLRSIRGIARGS
jgi:hypothetical protein